MKFAALISGGKDSVLSVMECERYGHECVCAANLHPGDGQEELDSHTFQSRHQRGCYIGGDSVSLRGLYIS